MVSLKSLTKITKCSLFRSFGYVVFFTYTPQPGSGLLLSEGYGYALHSYLIFLDYPINVRQRFSKITIWD